MELVGLQDKRGDLELVVKVAVVIYLLVEVLVELVEVLQHEEVLQLVVAEQVHLVVVDDEVLLHMLLHLGVVVLQHQVLESIEYLTGIEGLLRVPELSLLAVLAAAAAADSLEVDIREQAPALRELELLELGVYN